MLVNIILNPVDISDIAISPIKLGLCHRPYQPGIAGEKDHQQHVMKIKPYLQAAFPKTLNRYGVFFLTSDEVLNNIHFSA